jgi:L-fuconate dehydratase
MQTADMAGCFNCPVIPHTADAGLVHQHLVAATQNSPKQETVPYGDELFLHPVDIREGWLHIPEDPGASTEFKPDQFAKLRVA